MEDKEPNIHNAKKKQVIKQQSFLFDDLITDEILTRLPIKSILRFKSVSKQWYSLLSSSDFVNAHLMKSPYSHPSSPVTKLFINSCMKFYLFSYDNDQIQTQIPVRRNFRDNLVKLDSDFDIKKEDRFVLTGCCNGLICLTEYLSKCFVLWNPATRRAHKYEYNGCVGAVRGFGYSSSVDDYKYVQILKVVCGENPEKVTSMVHVFSLREKQWRTLIINYDDDVRVDSEHGVQVDEKLYWSGVCCGGRGDVIMSFDLGTERLDLFRYPSEKIRKLGGLGGCLCRFGCENSIEIMELPPRKVAKSIRLAEGFDEYWEVVGYTRTGKVFVSGVMDESDDKITLALVDQGGEESAQCTKLVTFEEGMNIARYVPSLVSPCPAPM